MSSPPPRLPNALRAAREWLQLAEEDALAARKLLRTRPPLPGIAVFHAQQAGEKALKAYLTAHNQLFPFTHQLEPLVARCADLDAEFRQIDAEARTLTPYATQFRYPDRRTTEASRAQARRALAAAERILLLVRQRLER